MNIICEILSMYDTLNILRSQIETWKLIVYFILLTVTLVRHCNYKNAFSPIWMYSCIRERIPITVLCKILELLGSFFFVNTTLLIFFRIFFVWYCDTGAANIHQNLLHSMLYINSGMSNKKIRTIRTYLFMPCYLRQFFRKAI